MIGNELNLQRKQVNAVIKLLDDGCTVPFIARYRKEQTLDLDETQVRAIQLKLETLRDYVKRREFIVEQIKQAGALTPELADRIEHTLDSATLEDIYLPYKPKRTTRAEMAREKGLEPLAKIIMAQNAVGFDLIAKKYVDGKKVMNIDEALSGAQDIIAEWMSENEKARNLVRSRYQRGAVLTSSLNKKAENTADDLYKNYYEFSKPLRQVPSHNYLAIRRGEAEGILKVDISINDTEMIERLGRFFIKPEATGESIDLVSGAVKDSYRRLIRPSIESEIAAAAKEKADAAAIDMFADNLRQRLMSPPMFGKRIMGIDPGFKSGCKVVCLDEQGQFLAYEIIYPNPPQGDIMGSTYTLCSMVDDLRIDVIAVGSGTAGRETEKFLRNVRYPRKVQIMSVSEDGASVYSASELARAEFPDLDLTVRSAVSIGRRVLDPLAELVKIEPKSIGVGQYQHDVDQNKLQQSLDNTVESCVNSVGVNVNTASAPLLGYVSGIGPALANYIVKYRDENGPFSRREDLLKVPRMGEKAYQQCAGFLRIPGGANPLDNTAIHPERYELVEQMARDCRTTVDKLKSADINIANYLDKTTGESTLRMILEELAKPGRDPRGEVETAQLGEGINSIRSLIPGMEVTGKINNITAFGAFVDLGIKENGLIHVSQLSEAFITNPLDVVHMDQIVRARVMDVDYDRGRIALTLKGVNQ
ncbi:MAG: RNA-binding transcriptional accessory protein [Muribaculaceae bacterium]|nr:RNA-binding transcriptional accessory protein [Bacteroides sp.]MBD5351382.1 RNA-binding transcriptional accessory protein [Bacteroides sp.]MBD5360107.1 RNA-binding transcriptional accessory protein [Bacteroides sp.]MDE6033703.1 RNA-binding transcriptional accessory protein [Muribaculaceae bacterium]